MVKREGLLTGDIAMVGCVENRRKLYGGYLFNPLAFLSFLFC